MQVFTQEYVEKAHICDSQMPFFQFLLFKRFHSMSRVLLNTQIQEVCGSALSEAVQSHKWRTSVRHCCSEKNWTTLFPTNIFHSMTMTHCLSLIGAQKALANSSAYCATKKQLSAVHSSSPCGTLIGQLDDGSHQEQLSASNTTVLPEPKLCPVVILGSQ